MSIPSWNEDTEEVYLIMSNTEVLYNTAHRILLDEPDNNRAAKGLQLLLTGCSTDVNFRHVYWKSMVEFMREMEEQLENQ